MIEFTHDIGESQVSIRCAENSKEEQVLRDLIKENEEKLTQCGPSTFCIVAEFRYLDRHLTIVTSSESQEQLKNFELMLIKRQLLEYLTPKSRPAGW